jgi:RES domain-containing protein
MEKQGAYTTADDMARLVIGTGTDDTIEVLAASGRAMHGQVILRIHVDDPAPSEFGSASHADGCFRYTFRYTAVPQPIPCPHSAPITLPPAAPSTTTTEN